MRNDYLVTISGRNIFRELELSEDSKLVRVGTTRRCDSRFRKELFFAPFELEFSRGDGEDWTLTCSEGVYFSVDGVRKLVYRKLEHGDAFDIKYGESGATLLRVSFSIDFGREIGAYDRYVDVSEVEDLTIGGLPNCNLVLNGRYTEGDLVSLHREDGVLVLAEQKARYGVRFNGLGLSGPQRLRDKSFFSIADFSFYYAGGRLFFSKTADITFSGIFSHAVRVESKTSEYPRFNRNTRVLRHLEDADIALLDPPSKPSKPKGNIVLQLLPAVAMLAITVVLRSTIMTGNSSFVILSAAMISVGILTSALGIVSERRDFRRETRERKQKYEAYISTKREEIEAERAHEGEVLGEDYPSLEREIEMVGEFSSELFDRTAEDDDFLDIRLGTGKRKAARKITCRDKEELDVDELSSLPRAVRDDYEYLPDAPIVVPARRAGAVGVVGPQGKRFALLKTLVIDLCARHYQNDLKLFFVVEPEDLPLVYWARNLPHVQNESLGTRNIVCDDESKNVVFEFLYKLLSARESRAGARGEPAALPHLVVFVVDECGLKNHPLSQFIERAADLGVTFVFFEAFRELLPQGCSWIVELERSEREGVLIDRTGVLPDARFAYEDASDDEALAVAQRLAPVYSEEVSLEGSLTKSLTMFEMLGIIAADDLDLAKRWGSTDITKSMAAPIGVTKSKTVSLDLSDKAHGPHGLVAGTTGSGKSEILLTYILSMATLFHPYEVGFVIIDFKGGGMVNQLKGLPHLIGAITNIDGREIDRSLKSIKAELQKRQRLFAEAGVNHVNAYIRKFKAGEVETALPHLVIIVDEFAELKAEQPEFMKELISASRIGRSLGVHLILATQKPAGQVNEQIWSNSRFKLCLKVQSKEDSNEVIKSPLAAEIREPGRAYLQVGNNEIFELLQSGFSGAPEHVDDDGVREFSLYQVEPSGKRVPIFSKKKKASEAQGMTQLEAIVEHVALYCEQERVEKLPDICLPPLADSVGFPRDYRREGSLFPLGVYDDPDNQYQGPALFDLDNANLFVVGSSQQGKTNFLQAIVEAIALSASPAQAALYLLDFGSMVLKNLEDLNHVGGVVLPSEDEKLKNLLSLLEDEVAKRRKRQLEAGVSSFSSYLEAGYTDLAHIYLIIDNFSVFKELYAERFEEQLLTLCREGVTYGITMVIANSSTSGFGYKYLSNFSSRVAFTCNDSSEYLTVFDRCRIQPKDLAGRGLFARDKTLYEFQSYLSFAGEREIERVREMRAFVSAQNARYGDARAARIPFVPEDLSLTYLEENYEAPASQMVLAMSYSRVAPAPLDLDSQFCLTVVGSDAQATARFMDAFFADVERRAIERDVLLYVVDDLNRSLSRLESRPYVESYTSDFTAFEGTFSQVADQVDERFELVREAGFEALAASPYLIVVVNSGQAVESLSESQDCVERFKKMSRQCAGMRVLFVFSGIEDASVGFSSPPLLKELKESRKGVICCALSEHKFFEIGPAQLRAFRGALEEGQAFFVAGNELDKVKIAVAQ